jgi:thiol:disulfide interchange protein DsbD
MRIFLATLLFLAATCGQAQSLNTAPAIPFGGAAAVEILPVDRAYRLEIEMAGERRLRLFWQIEPGYYLYQHQFAFQLNDRRGALAAEANLPPALERNDEYFGDVRVYYDQADITLDLARAAEAPLTLTVTSQGCADAGLCYPPRKQAFRLDPTSGSVEEIAPPVKRRSSPTPVAGVDLGGLPYMLLLAFLGGAILNLMPCVFPILSLKVLSFTHSSDHDRHLHSWVYTAGVVTSFVAVAALLIALQQAGRAVGWGFQLQSPGFVIGLAYLFLAMGLSLSGMIQLGGSLMNAGSGLANRSGPAGSFFTGVLAVVVASPCTAPFMGTALGFAVTQPAAIGLLVFAALGLGMAAPLLLFSYSGAARRVMPKPGPWMETLKQFLAFPLYGAAIWLLWVAGRQTGVNSMAAALSGGLLLALGLWLWQLGGWRRGLALASVIAALGLGSWRGLDQDAGAEQALANGRVAWSEQRLAELRSEGNPVFVDVTADWCITCLANETAVLFTDEMDEAFRHHGVVYMVADWTNYDADIALYIADHGRTGIPLYLMYPADPMREPLLLPQILTRGVVLEALQAVSPKKSEVAGNFPHDNR